MEVTAAAGVLVLSTERQKLPSGTTLDGLSETLDALAHIFECAAKVLRDIAIMDGRYAKAVKAKFLDRACITYHSEGSMSPPSDAEAEASKASWNGPYQILYKELKRRSFDWRKPPTRLGWCGRSRVGRCEQCYQKVARSWTVDFAKFAIAISSFKATLVFDTELLWSRLSDYILSGISSGGELVSLDSKATAAVGKWRVALKRIKAVYELGCPRVKGLPALLQQAAGAKCGAKVGDLTYGSLMKKQFADPGMRELFHLAELVSGINDPTLIEVQRGYQEDRFLEKLCLKSGL